MKNHSRWALVALVVSLLMTALIPTVEGNPPPAGWDVTYGVDGVFPENAVPLWTRDESGGRWSRSITFGDDILNLTRDDGLGTISYDQYIRSDTFDRSLGWKIEVRAKNMVGDSCRVSLYNGDGGETSIRWLASTSEVVIAGTSIGSGDSYTISDEYNVIRLVGRESTTSVVPTELYINGTLQETYSVYWKSAPVNIKFGCGIANSDDGYFELDYIAYDLDSKTDRQREIEDLQDQIDELKRELQKLKDDLEAVRPEIVINETELPTRPHDGRGTLEYDTLIDPWLVIVYDLNVHHDSASSHAFYLPYPASAEEVSVIEDGLFIGGTYSRLFVNLSAGGEILNTSETLTYFDLTTYASGGGQNITVEVNGASATVRASRKSVIRLTESFDWGYNADSGKFSTTATIENELAYDMTNVRVVFAFPTEDSEGRSISINYGSVVVTDVDNNLVLDRARHYSLDDSGVILEYRYQNTTGTTATRTIRVDFWRATLTESTEYYTIRDGDITTSDQYGSAPYNALVHVSQSDAASFEGMIIVKFDLTGKYREKQIDVNTLIIKRSDQSGNTEFWYDSVSNELRLTDISIDAGDSIVFSLFWDWTGPQTPVIALLVGEPLVTFSLILLTGFLGIMWFVDERNQGNWRKWAGLVGLIIALVAALLFFSGFGGVT